MSEFEWLLVTLISVGITGCFTVWRFVSFMKINNKINRDG